MFDGIMIAVSYVQSRLTVGNSDQFKSADAGAEAAFAGEQCGFTLCTYSKYLKLLVQTSAQRGSVA